ncbi:hypothetical protein GGX14DRAFT_408284 [Mycena pura]|uniref:Uncharacterized protein n=1 Tax=Mycena pura TaxID=153505 RepID=A0AAD6XW38_9AGAR|nr:hypothetical protein GGX14DRAFT_408284 [Mycena pura]
MVAAAFLWGPAKATKLATDAGTIPSNPSMADIHDVEGTTPGIITNAAIYTMYSLSIDTSLHPKGPQTGIQWKAAHDAILEYLLQGQRDRTRCIVELFRAWDAELFPDAENNDQKAPEAEQTTATGRSAALATLAAMEVAEPDNGAEEDSGDEL